MEREHFMQSAARTLGLSTEAVRESLKRAPKLPDAISGTTLQKPAAYSVRTPRELREEQILSVLHAYPETPLANRVKSEYFRISEAKLLPEVELPEPALFLAEQIFGEEPSEDAADELLYAFEEAVIREAYQEAVKNLRKAEAAGDAVAIENAQAVCAKLSARLASFAR